MDSLPSLAFSFARFVAREERRFHTRRRRTFAARRRNFSLNFNRRRNFGRNFNRRQSMNGGLRHRRAVLGVPRRRYGPGGGLRRRHNHRQHYNHIHHRVQNSNFAGTPRASTRAQLPRGEVQAMPEAVAAVPEAATAPEIIAVPEVAEDQIVDAVYEDEASATSITADADELLPLPPAFTFPPMEWLLGGPSAGWLVDDPERDDDELETPLPMMRYFERHGNRPRLPSLTPSDEVAEHFALPGYADVTEFFQPPVAVPVDAPPMALPDLNLPAQEVEEEKNEDAAALLALPTPPPEARVLLRRFASTMAARPGGIRRGTWSPEALGLTNGVAELRLNEAAPHLPSSSLDEPDRR